MKGKSVCFTPFFGRIYSIKLKYMKHILFALFALFTLTAPAFAGAQEEIDKAERYLQNLDKLRATFTQSYADEMGKQQILTGTFYLDRPGKLRFEFNEIEDFIVADGFFVYFYDAEERQQSNAPIGQTLADFLLRDDIKLREDVSVTKVQKSNGYTTLTMHQTADPQTGTLQVMFSDIPYRLVKWRVTDAQGTTVDIRLNDIVTEGISFPGGFFVYRDPHAKVGQFND